MNRRNVIGILAAVVILTANGCVQSSDVATQTTETGMENVNFDNMTSALEAGSLEQTAASSNTEEMGENSMNHQSEGSLRVRLTFEGGEAIVRLKDHAATRDFVSKLPMTQTFEDFNSIEKICRLPDEIATEGVDFGADPSVSDVTLYVPWNTLVFYYEDYGYNDSLIPMGHVESGMELLTRMGDEFQVTMELMEGEAESSPENDLQAQTTNITMTVGEKVITATLKDSATTRAFLDTLPRTLTMNHYGGREYYGRMESITEEGEAIIDFENGDVTYYPAGPSFAIFFAGEDNSSQGGLIRMGKITSDLSVFENLGDTVEMRIAVSE